MPKLLLADGDEFNRGMLSRRLVNSGHEVITAADGRAALVAAREYHPDLILMHLDLPVMDGRAAMRCLRNDPRTFRIPVIALSATASLEEVTQAAAAGFQACASTPVMLHRLLERIHELLGGKPASSLPAPY